MFGIAGHVVGDRHIEGNVGEHDPDFFALEDQPLVDGGFPGVPLKQPVASQHPAVARLRDTLGGRFRNNALLPALDELPFVFAKQQEIDLGGFKTAEDHVLAKIDQLLEFQPERRFVPRSRFTQPIESDPEQPEFGGAEMRDADHRHGCAAGPPWRPPRCRGHERCDLRHRPKWER